MKIYEHDGQFYRETGEERRPKGGEVILYDDGAPDVAVTDFVSTEYPILEPITVANWNGGKPTAWAFLSDEEREAVNGSGEVFVLVMDQWKQKAYQDRSLAITYIGITPVKPKRWRAEPGKTYWRVRIMDDRTARMIGDRAHACSTTEKGDGIDQHHYDEGSYYQTEAQAQAVADKINKFMGEVFSEGI